MSGGDSSRHHALARDGAASLELAACSEKGPVRRDNEDACAVRALDGGGAVLILADGMGGHADGRVASQLAVSAAMERLSSSPDPAASLGDAVADANLAIARHRRERGVMCGTTLVLAVIREASAALANIGDSRAYLIRGRRAHQVTRDHSWLADEMRAGRIPPGATAGDPRRNVLTRALAGEPVTPDLFALGLTAGETVLLCSDGVWEVLDDDALAAIMAPDRPLPGDVAEAVAAAIAHGSTDNATVVACRVGSP